MEEENLILEINLISAQGLKLPSANRLRIHTYALIWVESSMKLRSIVDQLGGGNPTWNDRFLFRVSPNFISRETAAVTVEIYAAGYLKDVLMGSVRLLLSNCLGNSERSTPAFTAVQVRRPSGKFHGVLNIAATVYGNEDFPLFKKGLSAISFRDLMTGETKEAGGGGGKWKRRLSRGGSKRSVQSSGGESCDFEMSSLDWSDGAESTSSTTSSSSSAAVASSTNALKDLNGLKKGMAGNLKVLKSDGGGGLMCGLMIPRSRSACFCPSDRFWDEENP